VGDMAFTRAAFNEAAPTFLGTVFQPADAGYDEARRIHNGLIDKRPAVVACCRGVADVADAVKAARAMGLEIAIRGGGHNVAGRATCDDGMMIDLSPMKGIVVDRRARVARAQGGVLWREFNRETQLHGLATTGGVVATTGIAGLTLGGGIGWLMPKYGLALDNLIGADVVLADGSVVRASADENPDLFWAIRGGGSNFGIAATLEYALHEVGPMITGGLVAHPAPRGADALKFFRDQTASLPEEMMLVAGLLTAPDGSGQKIVGMLTCHCGSLADGERAVKPIKAFGPPVVDHMGPIPYSVQNSLLDDAFPRGALNYWKSQFISELGDHCIKALLAALDAAPTPMCQIVVEHFHGAGARVPVDATACAMRREGFNVVIIGQWMEPRDTERGTRWVRDTFASLAPYMAPFRYVNYLEDDMPSDTAAMVYGANYPRLRALKAKYDPDNVFHTNVNVVPAA
jgi:FAD/FMN-containing dehydrogenase